MAYYLWPGEQGRFNIFPYDARPKTMEYYQQGIFNLIENSYESWSTIPCIDAFADNLIMLFKLNMINEWLLLKFFANSKEQHEIADIDLSKTKTFLKEKLIKNDPLKDAFQATVPVSKDRQFFIFELNQVCEHVTRQRIRNMTELHKGGRGTNYGRVSEDLETMQYLKTTVFFRQKMDYAYQLDDFEIAQVLIDHLDDPGNKMTMSAISELIKYIHINAYYLSQYTPLQLMLASKNFRFLMPDVEKDEIPDLKDLTLEPVLDTLVAVQNIEKRDKESMSKLQWAKKVIVD